MDNILGAQSAVDHSLPVGLAAIHLSPVLQSKEFRRGENWTGITSPSVRRRLQNRINQRARRRRKELENHGQLDEVPAIQVTPKSTRTKNPSTQGDFVDVLQISNMRSVTRPIERISNSVEESTLSAALKNSTGDKHKPCITRSSYRTILLARDFNNWVTYYRKRSITPFSSDHLLTLMFFNVVRAHTTNTALLGLTAEHLAEDTISPFCPNSALACRLPKAIPPAFYPTHLQKTIVHHPEIDAIPWPQIRDKLISAQGAYDDYELCEDMTGVQCHMNGECVEGEEMLDQVTLTTVEVGEPKKEPGLIVWNDPWRPESWEASESFVKKWRWLLVGCKELLDSTNYWREKRGEERLVWEV